MANVDIKLASSTRSSTIRSIDLGTSTPKLGGTVNISCYTNLQELSCVNNDVILLSGMDAIGVKSSLERVRMDYNKLTEFPPLTACSALLYFNVDTNVITTNIPNLLPNTALQTFICNNNSIQNWYGNDASISVNLGNFQAQNNLLTMNAVDGILHAFNQRGRNSATGSQCNLFLDGTGNSTPSFTGGVLLTAHGSGFSQNGVIVSYKAPNGLPASAVCHGLEDNKLYTFLDLSWSLTGTSVVTVDTLSSFSYKVSPYQSATVSQGTGTATIRYTLSAADGYRDYQILALPTDQSYGGEIGRGWDVRINQPTAQTTVVDCYVDYFDDGGMFPPA